jgi:hypothetical protein
VIAVLVAVFTVLGTSSVQSILLQATLWAAQGTRF